MIEFNLPSHDGCYIGFFFFFFLVVVFKVWLEQRQIVTVVAQTPFLAPFHCTSTLYLGSDNHTKNAGDK